MRKPITQRTAERLMRAAYDFSDLARRLQTEGHDSEAYAVRAMSSQLGNIGRNLADKLAAKP